MDKFNDLSSKMEELVNASRLNRLLTKKEEDEKKKNTIIWVLAIIGAIAAVAGYCFCGIQIHSHLIILRTSKKYVDDWYYDFDDEIEE